MAESPSSSRRSSILGSPKKTSKSKKRPPKRDSVVLTGDFFGSSSNNATTFGASNPAQGGGYDMFSGSHIEDIDDDDNDANGPSKSVQSTATTTKDARGEQTSILRGYVAHLALLLFACGILIAVAAGLVGKENVGLAAVACVAAGILLMSCGFISSLAENGVQSLRANAADLAVFLFLAGAAIGIGAGIAAEPVWGLISVFMLFTGIMILSVPLVVGYLSLLCTTTAPSANKGMTVEMTSIVKETPEGLVVSSI